jgi:hypothetical protein
LDGDDPNQTPDVDVAIPPTTTDDVLNASWQVILPNGIASAFAVSEDLLATNAHVVDSMSRVPLETNPMAYLAHHETGELLSVTQAWIHPGYDGNPARSPDVGIVRVDGVVSGYLRLADPAAYESIDVFDEVRLCGFPGDVTVAVDFDSLFTKSYRPRATCLSGQISALRPFDPTVTAAPGTTQLIQHDIATTQGTSGSPIYTEQWGVIAINAAGTTDNAGLNRFGPRVDTLIELLALVDSGKAIPIKRPDPLPIGPGCSNECEYAADGVCDDGGPGSAYSVCTLGTDCTDCGVRSVGCQANRDCPDDGKFCSGDAVCVNGTCGFVGNPCVGTALPVCDETADACVQCMQDADCPAPNTCITNLCTPPNSACSNDADCPDDGLFCNGSEFCDINGMANACNSTGNPCPDGETCQEDTDTCVVPGGTVFTLTTEADLFVGSGAADTFNAAAGTLNGQGGTVDVLDGGDGDNDTLNATIIGAATGFAPIIVAVEVWNLVSNGATNFFDLSATDGAETVNVTGNADITFEQVIVGARDFNLNDFDHDVTFEFNSLDGTNEFTLGLNGVDGSTITIDSNDGSGAQILDRLSLTSTGDSLNRVLIDTSNPNRVEVGQILLSGDQSCSINDSIADRVDATGFLGDLTAVGDQRANEIIGGLANDSLEGFSGEDHLKGGEGDDRLIGGSGSDQLTGGSGVDTFVFGETTDGGAAITGADVITDWSGTDDFIEIMADGGIATALGTPSSLTDGLDYIELAVVAAGPAVTAAEIETAAAMLLADNADYIAIVRDSTNSVTYIIYDTDHTASAGVTFLASLGDVALSDIGPQNFLLR